MLRKYLFWLIFLLFIASLVVGYSVNLFSGVKFDEKEGWSLVFEQQTEPGLTMKAPQLAKNYLGWQNFSKKDLLFVAWYKIKLSLNEDISGQISDLRFSFSLPGEIIKHNATRIEENTAIWDSLPQESILILETRQIRWWLIILILISIFLGILFSKGKIKGRRQVSK